MTSLNKLSWPRSLIVAVCAGVLNVLSFAPFFIWPLSILCLALIFALFVQHPQWNRKQTALFGASYVFGSMFVGVSWVMISMSRYGGMPWILSAIALTLFAIILSSFIACGFVLARYLRQAWHTSDTVLLLLVLPATWALSECLRTYFATGFPWLSTGYAHNISPLAGFAPILGVLGVGGIGALVAGALALVVLDHTRRWKGLLLIVVVVGIGLGLRQIAWTQESGQPLSVRLMQGNIDQGAKFDWRFVDATLAMYAGMVTAQSADLIAIPETALPILTSQLPVDYLAGLQNFAQTSGSHLFLGVAIEDGKMSSTNSVLAFSGKPQLQQTPQMQNYRYDKHHLVPFGEFVPFGFRWFVDMMKIPLGELSNPGVLQPAMPVKDQLVMPNICYEDLFGNEIARQLRAQAQTTQGAASILLNVSNLAWFGDSVAIPQHLQISQMRALETGRPILRSTNTGATAIINSHGEVVSQLAPLTQATLAGSVQGTSGLTPYIRFGDAFVMLLAGLALLSAYLLAKRPAA